jgi:radical SAM family uncharacterized protein/radical SAM-linked protein
MFEHPYAPFLAKLNRPGQYLGGEFGAHKGVPEATLQLALGFPDSYEIGMSHMGLSVLYELMGRAADVSCERVFMPWADLEAALRAHRVPLVSLETAKPLRTFDLLGFSLQYELNYTNLLAMLDLGQIPLHSEDRQTGDPIVIVGGPVAIHSEPLTPFIDLCLIGDGEEALPALCSLFVKAKKEKLARAEIIDLLAEEVSVFAPNRLTRRRDVSSGRLVVEPDQPKVATRAIVTRLGDHPPGFGPVPSVKAVFDRYSVEVARGCAGGCRFCQAGFLYRPVRERSKEEIDSAVDRAVRCLGYDSISLAGLSTADHSQLEPLIANLGQTYTPLHVSLAVPSLRAYGLSESVVEVLGRLRATGVTLAPEAGSQRMRDVINKNITEEDLTAAATRFFDQGFHKIKLYFMLGLPGETDQDLEAIIDLSDQIQRLGRKRLQGRNPTITVSVSNFIPKPFTPFEREAMLDPDEINRRQRLLKSLAAQRRLKVRFHDPRLSIIEALFCRGDIGLAPVLEKAFRLGARFDGWNEIFDQAIWEQALEGFSMNAALGPIPDHGRLPWDHMDSGIDPGFLEQERTKARKAEITPPCGRFETMAGGTAVTVCHACGIKCKPSSLAVRSLPLKTDTPGAPPAAAARPQPKPFIGEKKGTGVRVRLYLAKWGATAYIGHLDTMGNALRALRRAGLEIVYTQGFHPKPKVEAPPPLPLGVGGLEEPIDVHLIDPPSETDILKCLEPVMPAGMAFVAARKIPPHTRSLGKLIEAAEYLALAPVTRSEARHGLERLISSKSIEVTRERKGKIKQVDIRPYLTEALVLDEAPRDTRLPLANDGTWVAFTLALPPSGGARAREILEAAFGEAAASAVIFRTKLVLGT